MKDNIVIKNRIIKFFSIVVVVIFAIGVAAGVFMLKTEGETESESYSIIVDDEITVYTGETYTIVPYLINKEGTVVESRFDYTSLNEALSVDVDGVITVNSVPEDDAYISIYERNTSTSTKIKVNVVANLTTVLGITFSDAAGNKILISGEQELSLSETYVLNIVTEPADVDIEDYCELLVTDADGEEKEVFEFEYSGTSVSMKVVGLGSGELNLNILGYGGQSLYTSKIDFTITMADEDLGNEILESANSTLLSKNELAEIETLELESISDFNGLQGLTSLKTIVFTSDEVVTSANISADYCYRVKTTVFESYLASEIWSAYSGCIIPYETDVSEVYVVFHNDKTESGAESVTYEKLSDISSFPKYTYTGYSHYGWLDESGTQVSVSGVKKSVTLNGIHLYAGWSAISYTVVYHIRSTGGTYNETWFYDQEGYLKTPSQIDGKVSKTGYKFAGWSRNANSSETSTNIQYVYGELVSNLASTSGTTIDLYDIWEPNEYTIIFNTPDDMEAIGDLTVKYATSYTLPTPVRLGYEFSYWLLSSGETLTAGVKNPALDKTLNLAEEDGAEVVLTPVFEEITYTITFEFNGGEAVNDLTIYSGFSVDLLYTQSYSLPYLEKVGYTVYSWQCLENGKIFGSTDTIVKEFTSTCSVTFEAVWTSAIYTVNYDCNGGSVSGESYITASRYWDDGATMLTPTRTGYTFGGWLDGETGVTYTSSDEEWSGNVISSEAENGKIINLTAVWSVNYYTLTVTQGTGTTLTVKVNGSKVSTGSTQVAYGSTITVSYSANTGYSGATCTYTGGTMPASSLTIKTSASINYHKVTISVSDATITVKNASGTTLSSSALSSIAYGTTLKIEVTYSKSKNQTCYCSYNGNTYYSGNTSYTMTMPDYDVTLYASSTSSCLAKGTMIMLGDGSSVAVENVEINDVILSYDHATGQYVENKVLFVFYDYGYAASIDLYFSNGATLEFLNNGHGLYDVTLCKYVLIDEFNAQDYIGHSFLYADYVNGGFVAETVTLTDCSVTYKEVERYDLVTENTLNHIANGLLACSDTLVGVCNMFEFNADATYNLEQMQADIAEYGLYTYEEWSEYLSYDDFVSFNGAYFKVAVGKGLITIDEIFSLLEDLAGNR